MQQKYNSTVQTIEHDNMLLNCDLGYKIVSLCIDLKYIPPYCLNLYLANVKGFHIVFRKSLHCTQ